MKQNKNKIMKPDQVFEVSFEVCNKIGGIYTVIKSKAQNMVNYYENKYCTIGVFNPKKPSLEFEPEITPDIMSDIFNDLEKQGIKCYYGTWLISGKPKTILIDSTNFMKEKNNIKKDLWDWYKVDSIRSDIMFDEPVVWSTAAGMLIEKICERYNKPVAQFHEWLSGAGLLYLKKKNLKIGTVFTTHATILGRTIASANVDLSRMINEGIKKKEIASLDLAAKYGVLDKHTLELACANACDVFSTVSDTTAKECEYIFGVKPDIILPNGLVFEEDITNEELVMMRKNYRKRMKEFLTAYFSRYYSVDFENIRSIFISGRYEFHNKGIDLFISALGMLNKRLKLNKIDKTIIAFILIPSKIRGEKMSVLKDISLYREMDNYVESNLPNIKERILSFLSNGELPKNTEDLFGDDFIQTCRNMMMIFISKRNKQGAAPPLCAFDLDYPEQDDAIVRALLNNDLLNREEDKVKVIFYPSYLNPGDRLIGLSYEPAMRTFDLGVFPSYYEPWGYTPLEAAKHGVLSITTDLSGFGKFIEGKDEIKNGGIWVIKRENRTDEDVLKDLVDLMYRIVLFSRNERVRYRMLAKDLASLADWNQLFKNYITAHELSLENLKKS